MGRLDQLGERIDDTEDLVNIDLDNRRNQIVAIDLVVTSVTLMFTFVTSVSGIFGMNLRNSWEERHDAFVSVTVGAFLLGAAIFLAFMMYVRVKRLMFIPDPNAVLRIA